MRELVVAFAVILILVDIGSALYVHLPGYQAIGLTIFGACVAGLGAFGAFIAVEEKKRSHPR